MKNHNPLQFLSCIHQTIIYHTFSHEYMVSVFFLGGHRFFVCLSEEGKCVTIHSEWADWNRCVWGPVEPIQFCRLILILIVLVLAELRWVYVCVCWLYTPHTQHKFVQMCDTVLYCVGYCCWVLVCCFFSPPIGTTTKKQ